MKDFSIYSASLFAAFSLAGAASAECFGPDDLTRGLSMEYESGDVTTIRRIGDGTHLVREDYVSGDPSWALRAHHGVYFVEEWQIEGEGRAAGSGLSIEFPIDPALLPVPVPGLSWQGQTTNYFESGGSRPESTSITFTDGGQLTISDCTYNIVNAGLVYDWGDEGSLNLRYIYFTEIGTAFLLHSEFDNETKAPQVPLALVRATK